jgi:hypothetical protein
VAALCKPAGDLIGMGRPAEIAGDWDATRDVEDFHGLHALVALEVEDDAQRPFGDGRDGLLCFGDGGIFDAGQNSGVAAAQKSTARSKPSHAKALFDQGVDRCISDRILSDKY